MTDENSVLLIIVLLPFIGALLPGVMIRGGRTVCATFTALPTAIALLLLLLLAQLLAGLTTIFFEWPLLIAVLHNGGAAGLTLFSVTLLVRLHRSGQAKIGI